MPARGGRETRCELFLTRDCGDEGPHDAPTCRIANIVFSICAALASLLVSVLSAIKGAPAVAVVFGLLFVGFLVRAREGQRRRRTP
jgi:hypothetical protein